MICHVHRYNTITWRKKHELKVTIYLLSSVFVLYQEFRPVFL